VAKKRDQVGAEGVEAFKVVKKRSGIGIGKEGGVPRAKRGRGCGVFNHQDNIRKKREGRLDLVQREKTI